MYRYRRLVQAGESSSHPDGGEADANQPTSVGVRMDTDLNSAISAFLSNCEDHQLYQLTRFYMKRLEQAIEERVEEVGFMLMGEDHFTGSEYHSVTELAEKGNRAGASKLLLDLVMEKGSEARRMMWESFVKLHHHLPKLSRILDEIRERGDGQFAYMDTERGLPEMPTDLKDVQRKHMGTLRAQTETLRVNMILMREKVKVFQLVDRYAELTVISTVRDRTLVEHELLARGRDHEEWREKHLRGELEKIGTDQLFKSSFVQKRKRCFFGNKSGMSAAVAGVSGIGKTTMVQKIVYDWATGKIYQQFQFVFSFKFRDLNTINCRINLRELILDQYPYFGNILREVWKNPEGLLFIFDGLDEFKHKIDFADSRRDTEPKHQCPDPEWWCEVSDIVCSLIQGKLLPGCSVLVTTRPTALHLLEKAMISVWAEILGFDGEERKEYFIKNFEDQSVAADVFKHVKENEILYTMSYNPSYCLFLALTLGPFFTQRVRGPQRVPKTITQLYSYYIYNILKNHGREIENPRDVLLRVGQMAFRGVSEKKIVFTSGDLIKNNLQPSQFLSGFLMELLEREDSARSVVYTFPHLTIQEFVAAVTQFLNPHPGDILKFLTESHNTTDGQFHVFLRFVAGLSSPMTAPGLEEFLGPFPEQTTCRVIDWVKKEVKRQSGNTWSEAGKRSLLNTLHYLFESQNSGLAQAALGSVKKLSFSGMTLTPIDCAVLSHVIGLCDAIKHLNLEGCHIQCKGIQWLGPGLYKCQELSLGWNKLEDAGVKLVSAALRMRECKIQKLWLDNVGLRDSDVEDLVSALSTNTSLTELDLGANKLGDSGVKRVCEALRNSESKIQKLWLYDVGLTANGAKDLISTLSTNRSLTELNLNDNKLGDSGVKLVSDALRNPECKIQKLWLWNVGLTVSGAEDLSPAINTNRSLTELNLNDNQLGDSRVKLLSAALRNSKRKIKKLWLRNVGLTDSGAEDLVSTLSTNPSLTELNLGANELGDSGVKLVSAALTNSKCCIQKLWLRDVGLTDSGAGDLVSALSTNRSLTELNLGVNKLGDSGVKLVSAALRNVECKLQKLWLCDVGLTANGAKDLISTLSTNRSLTELSLNDNKLGDLGVKLLSAALRISECKLQKLWLRNVRLTDSGVEDLASVLSTNPSLTELNLGANELGDLGVKLVSAALTNSNCCIQKLWLYDVGLTANGAKDLISTLSTSRSLKELSLSDNNLGDSGVKLVLDALRVSECNIQKLWLWNVGLTDSGAGDLNATLGGNPSLTVLNLNNNKLEDLGVKLVSAALKKSRCKLQELGLRDVGLTDSGAKDLASALSTNPSLTELNLNDNKLGDSGVKLLSEALKKAKCKIQKLWLRDVGLTNPGAEDLASALSSNPSLMELNLGANELGDSGVKLVSAALTNSKCCIQKLWLFDVSLTANGAKDLISTLSTSRSLKELSLSDNNLGDSGVKLVSAALRDSECKIQKLWLWNVGLTDSGAGDLNATLGGNPSLTVLNLNNNKLEDLGVKLVSAALKKSRCKLQELGLRDVGLTDSGAKDLASALSTNPSLTELNLNDNKLGDSGVKLLSEALKKAKCKIQKLWLRDVGLTNPGAEDLASALSSNPSLMELNLGANKLGDSGVKMLSAALKNSDCKIQKLWLMNVGLTDSAAGDFVSALGTKTSLMVLSLNNNKLGDSGVKLVSAALMKSRCKLQELGLKHVGLTDSGARDLASALSTNPSLTELDLNDNHLGDSGVKLLSAALRNADCKIQKLWLRHVGLTDSGAEDLVSALSTKPSLTELNLGANELGDSGVELVSAALRNSECKIQKFWLYDVGLTDSGVEDLVSALSTNPSLTELDLGGNKLGDSGVKLLSPALRNPECKIQKLGLNNVDLTDSGADDLVSALSTNPSLTELNLGLNSLTDRSVPDLRSLIQTLPSLKRILLDGNQFSETGKKELDLCRNPDPD
ncbi:LOW QUALITY PROTEIN: NACHT, LRR and PYD domains-containing protein 12-like [Mobula hypostoma]|uniref:LOW QUALITY PROTEIN: NACHT, LRR and PYD domains-containing protein 12-like n=1 Tax=Mobula hypostoma TaxID=723540 RepID=UPI002FC37A0E